jgi:hypothetical protein
MLVALLVLRRTLSLSLCRASFCSCLSTLLMLRWHSRQQQDWRQRDERQLQEGCVKPQRRRAVVAGVNPVCRAARGAAAFVVLC